MSLADSWTTAAQHDFRQLIVHISESLVDRDVNRICYLYKELGSQEQYKTTLDILDALERKGIFSYCNASLLKQFLQTIQRCDLSFYVDTYISKHSHFATLGGTGK